MLLEKIISYSFKHNAIHNLTCIETQSVDTQVTKHPHPWVQQDCGGQTLGEESKGVLHRAIGAIAIQPANQITALSDHHLLLHCN